MCGRLCWLSYHTPANLSLAESGQSALERAMFGGDQTRDFLMWIGGMFVAATIAIFAVSYVVDNVLLAPSDSLTTQGIRKK